MASHYRQIDGKKYSAVLLDAVDKMVAGQGDGRISKEDAEVLYGDLFDGMKKGLFHTPILKTYSLEEIHEAVEHAERSSGSGKVLLIPDHSR